MRCLLRSSRSRLCHLLVSRSQSSISLSLSLICAFRPRQSSEPRSAIRSLQEIRNCTNASLSSPACSRERSGNRHASRRGSHRCSRRLSEIQLTFMGPYGGCSGRADRFIKHPGIPGSYKSTEPRDRSSPVFQRSAMQPERRGVPPECTYGPVLPTDTDPERERERERGVHTHVHVG